MYVYYPSRSTKLINLRRTSCLATNFLCKMRATNANLTVRVFIQLWQDGVGRGVGGDGRGNQGVQVQPMSSTNR